MERVKSLVQTPLATPTFPDTYGNQGWNVNASGSTRELGVERSDATHPKKKAHLASYYGSKEGFESYLSDASTRTRRTATEVARITNYGS